MHDRRDKTMNLAARPVRVLAAILMGVTLAPMAAASESADELVRRCLESIRLGEAVEARACFAPDALPENADELLEQAYDALQIGDPPEVEVVNRAVAYTARRGRADTLVYHVRGDAKALLVVARTREAGASAALVGLRWETAPLDLSDRYPFRFTGVPLLYYGVLGLAVVTPLFMLYAAILCLRSKPRRRWLWLLFILVGVGQLSVVWVPGPLNLEYLRISPVSFQLFGAGIKTIPVYDPWVLSISFPLGAVLFIRSRRREAAERSPQDVADPSH
jgi:hypothetical protein